MDLLDLKALERENDNIYDKYNVIVNVNLNSIFRESKDNIHMFSREGKKNLMISLFIFSLNTDYHGVPQDIKCKKTKIVRFRYKI